MIPIKLLIIEVCQKHSCFGFSSSENKNGQNSGQTCITNRECTAVVTVVPIYDNENVWESHLQFNVYLTGVKNDDSTYVSVGLSDDQKMGSDVNVDCLKYDSARGMVTSVRSSFNALEGGQQQNVFSLKGDADFNVGDFYSHYSESSKILHCQWSRSDISSFHMVIRERMNIPVPKGKNDTKAFLTVTKPETTYSKDIDFTTNGYHILMAFGEVDNHFLKLSPHLVTNAAAKANKDHFNLNYHECQRISSFKDKLCLGTKYNDSGYLQETCVHDRNCDVLVIVTMVNNSVLHFHIRAKDMKKELNIIDSNATWFVSLELSQNNENTENNTEEWTVADCTVDQRTPKVQKRYNHGHIAGHWKEFNIEDNSAYVSNLGGVMRCSQVEGKEAKTSGQYDLVKETHFLTVQAGIMDTDQAIYWTTERTILFPQFQDTLSYSFCNLKRRQFLCYGMRSETDVNGENCTESGNCIVTAIFDWKNDDNNTLLLIAKLGLNYIASIAFSTDEHMGDDIVLDCGMSNTTGLYSGISWNTHRKMNIRWKKGLKTDNIKFKQRTYNNGTIACSFQLDEEISVTFNSTEWLFNLTTTHVFLAYGRLRHTQKDDTLPDSTWRDKHEEKLIMKKSFMTTLNEYQTKAKDQSAGNSGIGIGLYALIVLFILMPTGFIGLGIYLQARQFNKSPNPTSPESDLYGPDDFH